MGTESEAFKVWWSLHPTLTDVMLLLFLIMFVSIFWTSITGNRKERKRQIEEIKALALSNIDEIKKAFAKHTDTMSSVISKLQDEKAMIQEHLVRHEGIAADITRICKVLDDHEVRVRKIEWDGNERRGGG